MPTPPMPAMTDSRPKSPTMGCPLRYMMSLSPIQGTKLERIAMDDGFSTKSFLLGSFTS